MIQEPSNNCEVKTNNAKKDENKTINPQNIKEDPLITYELHAQRYLSNLYRLSLNSDLLKTQDNFEKNTAKPSEIPTKPAVAKKNNAITSKINKQTTKNSSVSPAKPALNAQPLQKQNKSINYDKDLKNINSEKVKINEKIKEIETKISVFNQSVGPLLNSTPTKKLQPFNRTRVSPSQKNNLNNSNNNSFEIDTISKKKIEFEKKRAQKLEEKEQIVKKELEKLNSEKEKIVEVFKLEKEKLFWRKMHELEERKAERINKEIEYKSLVKNLVKNNKLLVVKTPELDKRKQEIAQKRKLYSEYSMKIDNSIREKTPVKKTPVIQKNIRSLTPNQTKPNYLIVCPFKIFF